MTAQPTIPTIVRTNLVLEVAQREAIRQSARHAYPNEFCGLLLGKRVGQNVIVSQVVNTPNVAPIADRTSRYEINPGLLLAWEHEAEKEGLKIVGMVHSYPEHAAEPSEQDFARAWPGYIYLIAGVHHGAVTGLAAWQFCESTKEFERVAMGE
ncbi:MAG: M67 family metallopeptidase [Tepidisphaeraceae bacterium]